MSATEEIKVVEPSTSQPPPEEIAKSEDISDVEKMGDVKGKAAEMTMQNEPVEFVGMGKEELMTLANDPFWVRLRWALFISFWLVWLGLLVGAALIIGLSPGCEGETVKKIGSSTHNR